MRKAQAGRSKGPPKASCECEGCSNRRCPNAVEVPPPFASRLNPKLKTVPKLNFGKLTKIKRRGKKKAPAPPPEVRRPSILNMLNTDRACACEVMVKAIASPLHMNLGLSHVRDAINADLDTIDTPDELQTATDEHEEEQ